MSQNLSVHGAMAKVATIVTQTSLNAFYATMKVVANVVNVLVIVESLKESRFESMSSL